MITPAIQRFIDDYLKPSVPIKPFRLRGTTIRTRVGGQCPMAMPIGADNCAYDTFALEYGLTEEECSTLVDAADNKTPLNRTHACDFAELRAALLAACNLKEEAPIT